MIMMSHSSQACLIALTPTDSNFEMSTPIFPTIILLSMVLSAKVSVSPVMKFLVVKPTRYLPSMMGSLSIPPIFRSSLFSISMTLSKAVVLPAPGRPVIPILMSEIMIHPSYSERL